MRTLLTPMLFFPLFLGLLPFAKGQGPIEDGLYTKSDLLGKYDRYPPLEQVRELFRKHHRIDGLEDIDAYLRFEKKPKGWVVAVIEDPWNPWLKQVREGLFWSAEDGKFRRLSLKGLESGKSSQELLRERSFNTDGFSIALYEKLPFYGYPEWDLDLIERLGGRDDLSDSLAFALGRAYKSRASKMKGDTLPDILALPTGFSERDPVPDPILPYELCAHRAVALFDSVEESSPDFGTYFGPISILRDHQVIRNFMDLYVTEGRERAEEELEDGLYSPFVRSIAKNNLRSCDSNAVLLTRAVMNIFPLLYMQFHHGIREDVKVVTHDYFSSPTYMKKVWSDAATSKPLRPEIGKEHYSELSDSYVMVEPAPDSLEDRDELLDLRSWLDSLEGKIAEQKKKRKIQSSLRYAFKLCLGEDTLVLKDSSSYLAFDDLMVLELLAEGQKGRAIHKTIGFPEKEYYDLEDDMDLIGSVYHLWSAEGEGDYHFDGAGRSHRLFTEEFEYEGFDRIRNEQERFLISNQIWCIGRIVNEMRGQDNDRQAKDLIRLLPEQYLRDSSLFALYEDYGVLLSLRGLVWNAYYFDMDELGDHLSLKILQGTRRQGTIVTKEHREYILKTLWYTLKNYDRFEVMEHFTASEEP